MILVTGLGQGVVNLGDVGCGWPVGPFRQGEFDELAARAGLNPPNW